MPISLTCGACDAKLNAPDAAAGKRVKCRKCGAILEVPMPAAEADHVGIEEAPTMMMPPLRKAPSPAPAMAAPPPSAKAKPKPVALEESDPDEEDDRPAPKKKRRPAVDLDDDDEDRPTPKKKGKKPSPKSNKLPLLIGGGVLGLALVGFLLYWFALREPEVAKAPVTNSPGSGPVMPPGPQPGGPGPVRPGPQTPGTPTRPAMPPAGWKLVTHPEFSAWFGDKGRLGTEYFDKSPLPEGFPYPLGTRMVTLDVRGMPAGRPMGVFVVPLTSDQKTKAATNLGDTIKAIFGREFFGPNVAGVALKDATLDGKPAVEWSDNRRTGESRNYLGAVANGRAYLLIVGGEKAGGENVTADDEAVKTFRGSFRFGTNVPPPDTGNTGGPKVPVPPSASGELEAALTGKGLSEAEAKRRLAVINDLKQFAIGLEADVDNDDGFLPPIDGSGVTSKDGKSVRNRGLSWRAFARAEPYPHDEKNLDLKKAREWAAEWQKFMFYTKIDPDKPTPKNPWDIAIFKEFALGPHSCPLIDKRKAAWDTYYRVLVGNGAAFEPGKRLGWTDFKDGRDKTILIVAAGEAVPWPKPDELAYDPNKPLPKLGGLFSDGFYAVFADGKVRFIKNGTDEKLIRAWITRNGGEVAELPPAVNSKAMRAAAGYKD